MRKIRIAQIGTNTHSHAPWVFESLKKQSDLFEIVGYALPENERERLDPSKWEIFNGYREMTVDEILGDPTIEAVAVETDEIYLTKYATLAAKHGKHIHMEKPGGIDLAEFETMIETVRESGVVFHTGYMYRYNPAVRDLLAKIKAGDLGEIVSIDAQMSCIQSEFVRHWLKTFPGGMMFFLGCHLIDLIMQIKGVPQNVISLNVSTGLDGTQSEDIGFAVLQYPNALCTAKTSAVEFGGFSRRTLFVSGSKGSVELCPLEMYAPGENGSSYLYTEQITHTNHSWHDRGTKEQSEYYDRYDDMMASFAAMVRGEKTNPYTLDYELELYRTVLKCCGV